MRAPLALYVPAVVYRARTCCPCCVGQYGQVALACSVKLKQGSLGPRYAVVIWVSIYNKAAGAYCNAITYKLWKLLELEPATSRITLPL